MDKIIISGATGAIGMALIRECIMNGTKVLVLCRRDSGRNDRIPKHPLVEIQYCALDEMKECSNCTGNTYDVFYHFAWEGTTGAQRNDMHLQNRNVAYALDAVELAKRFGCHTFIGAGSQAEYGRVEGLLESDTKTNPEMGYGIAKLCAGQMTRLRAQQLGMKHIWVRVLSVYGPYDGEGSMISTVIRDLKNGISPKCTAGEQKWDYLYSADAAKAFYKLGIRGTDGKVYVLGSGDVKPLRNYIETIQSITAPETEVAFGAVPYADRQVMYLGADISEIKKDTAWEPETSFEDGIRNIVEES